MCLNSLLFHCFHFRLTFESINELKSASQSLGGMLAKLRIICYLILIENFNMVEQPLNKFQLCGRHVPKVEKTLKDQMIFFFKVEEFLSSNGSFMLSWDNCESGEQGF